MSERSPVEEPCMGLGGAHDATRLRQDIFQELGNVVDPMGAGLNREVATALAAGGDVVTADEERLHVTASIPYDETCMRLPALLFGGVSWSTLPEPGRLTIPPSAAERNTLIDVYANGHEDILGLFPPVLEREGLAGWNKQDEEVIDRFRQSFHTLYDRGVTIDPVAWREYTRAAQDQLRSGWYTLDTLTATRLTNVDRMQQAAPVARLLGSTATGRFARFMTATSDAFGVYNDETVDSAAMLVAPVGAYGRPLTEKILRTTAYLQNISHLRLRGMAVRQAAGHETVIARHTARGGTRSDIGRSAPDALMAIHTEGIRSIGEVLYLLTAERVEPYDYDDLVAEILRQDLVRQFTRIVPMGMTAPFALKGAYFPGLVEHRNGRLNLNQDIVADIRQSKLEQRDEYEALWQAACKEISRGGIPAEMPSVMGLMCVAARPHGAVATTAEALGRAYRMISPGAPEHWRLAHAQQRVMWDKFADLYATGHGALVERIWQQMSARQA